MPPEPLPFQVGHHILFPSHVDNCILPVVLHFCCVLPPNELLRMKMLLIVFPVTSLWLPYNRADQATKYQDSGMTSILSSLQTLRILSSKTCGTTGHDLIGIITDQYKLTYFVKTNTSDDTFGITTTLGFHCLVVIAHQRWSLVLMSVVAVEVVVLLSLHLLIKWHKSQQQFL